MMIFWQIHATCSSSSSSRRHQHAVTLLNFQLLQDANPLCGLCHNQWLVKIEHASVIANVTMDEAVINRNTTKPV
jgi:hypothetical protein